MKIFMFESIKIGEEGIKLIMPVHQITSATMVTTVLPVLPLLLSFYQYFASPTIQQFYQWLWQNTGNFMQLILTSKIVVIHW